MHFVSLSPTAPTDVEAYASGSGELRVSWTSNAGMDSHSLRYRLATEQDWTTLTRQSSPTTLTGLANGANYQLQVGAVVGGETAWSSTVTALASDGTPYNVAVEGGNRQMTITWTDGPGAEEHRLRFRTTGSAWRPPTGDVFSPWHVSALANNTEYEVQVGAVHGAETKWSAIVKVTPVDPTIFSTNMTVGESGSYLGYSQDNFGTLSPNSFIHQGRTYVVTGLQRSSVTTLLYTDPILPKGTSDLQLEFKDKTYRLGTDLRLLLNSWEGPRKGLSIANGDRVLVRFTPVTGGAPAGVTALPDPGKLTVSWITAYGADSHSVRYRTKDPQGPWMTLANQTSPVDISDLSNDTEYEVQVGAVDGASTQWSAALTAAPSDGKLRNVRAEVGDGMLRITWTAAVGAASHTLRYRDSTDTSATWTTLTNQTSPVDITGLSNGTAYDVQVIAVFSSSDQRAADIISATPMALLSGTMTVGSHGSGTVQEYLGYNNGGAIIPSATIGSTNPSPPTFTHHGATYTVTQLLLRDHVTGTDHDQVWFDTDPELPSGTSDVQVTFKDKMYTLGTDLIFGSAHWTGAFKSLSISDGETNVPIKFITVSGGKPGGVELRAGRQEIQATWIGASSADSYSLHYRVKDETSWAATLTSQTSPVTITGLDNGTEYEVQVGAVYGATTNWSDSVTTTPNGSVPPAPYNLQQDLVDDGSDKTQVIVTWNRVDQTTNDFQVAYKLTSSATWTVVERLAVTNDSETLTNLVEGANYHFRVSQKNSHGWSAWSDILLVNPSLLPTDFADTSGINEITVSWTEAAGADAHFVEYRPDEENTWTLIDNATSPTTIPAPVPAERDRGSYKVRVGTVFNGQRYRVKADNAFSVPTITGPSNVVVAPGDQMLTVTGDWPPSFSILNVFVKEVGAEHSASPYSCLYDISAHYANCASSFPITESTHQGSGRTAESLVNGTEYEVELWFQFATDTTSYEIARFRGTPSDGMPTYVEAEEGDAALTVSWVNGPGAESHTLRYRESGSTGPWTELTSQTSPVALSSLANGTAYEIQVGAVFSGAKPTQWSDSITATPGDGTPSHVAVALVSDGALTVTWTDGIGADSHPLRHRVKSPVATGRRSPTRPVPSRSPASTTARSTTSRSARFSRARPPSGRLRSTAHRWIIPPSAPP